MECTDSYMNNAQVVVVPADKADKYQDEESVKDLTFAVEAGSAGEDQVEQNWCTVYSRFITGRCTDGSCFRKFRCSCN